MRILTVHADFIEVEALSKAIKDAEAIDETKKEDRKKRYDEVLVVFTAVEEGDEDVAAVAQKLASETENVAKQLKAKNILLYPLVHLTSKPSAPRVARAVIDKAEGLLKHAGYSAEHSPFGWYKGYTLKCKGHPLSELSRELKAEGDQGKQIGVGVDSGTVNTEELGIEKSKSAALETASHLIYENVRQLLKKEFISISYEEGGFGNVNWWGMKSLSDEDVKNAINKANELVSNGEEVRIEFMTKDEALKKCGNFYKQALPQKADRIRVVSIGTLPPEPCKNKHIPNINLIKSIKLEEIKREEENMKVRFSVELSQEVEAGEVISASLKQESVLKSHFHILDLDGKLHEIEKFNYGKHDGLKTFATYETKKVRAYETEPPHIKIMKEHGLIDYEPGSDSGNFRFLPKGRLIKKILERAITDYCSNYGAMEVETPIMYDYEHPTLKKYLNRFPARQYTVLSEDKKLFLRFAACFGQFLIAHDMVISHKHLPLKMFELTRYSFRREQGGELAGLKRLRAFTMPDMHTFCEDIGQAKTEFEAQFFKSLDWMNDMGLDSEAGFRVQEDFFEENRDWYLSMVKKWGKPVLVELFKERYAYFITKFEFNFIDNNEKASALSTVQIDVENADTYDINYIAEDGSKKKPFILHASISGSLERVIYALLENEARKMKQGKKAMLPIWLAPTQVRIIPVSEKHLEHAKKIMAGFENRPVRVDIDDRNELLGKKIRDAEKEWIPYVAVVGDREIESGKLSVTMRASGEKKEMKTDELAVLLEKENSGKPFEMMTLAREVSKRAII